MIDLSILICSTHTRWKTFGQEIQKQVWEQYDALPQQYQDAIEIIMLTDSKSMMLGHKRNTMVDIAQGRYVQFIDDDDRIEPDMFRTVLDAITESDADVINFLVEVTINGGAPKICRYSKDYVSDLNTDDLFERLPNHICAVKRELAQRSSFPNIPHGEDSAYSRLLHEHLKTEHQIDRVLYHYDYNDESTETQVHHRAALRRRQGLEPIVDVVIMSNATTPKLQGMTQNAVRTCVAAANSLPVNVIVLEQQPNKRYAYASTIHVPEDFHYNQFANKGARYGYAEWLMIANNDLIFEDGWLHRLLAADHPVVSPKEPNDIRQKHITENTTGYNIGEHFSGWCFMIKRELWQEMGGFDPDFAFWCADDAVVEQLRAFGIEPMVVADAHVHHIGSVTLRKEDVMRGEDLTWGQLDRFIEKYGYHRLGEHPGFLEWKESRGAVK